MVTEVELVNIVVEKTSFDVCSV